MQTGMNRALSSLQKSIYHWPSRARVFPFRCEGCHVATDNQVSPVSLFYRPVSRRNEKSATCNSVRVVFFKCMPSDGVKVLRPHNSSKTGVKAEEEEESASSFQDPPPLFHEPLSAVVFV